MTVSEVAASAAWLYRSAAPLRFQFRQLSDPLIKIPLIVKYPGQFAFSELQFGSQTNSKIGYMLRSDSYKLLVYGNMQDCVFYDLKKDPFELHDVSKEPDYQETLHRYQTALSDFVLFHALGKVHLDTKAPQQRNQEVLNRQAEELKAFIRSQW